jgi:CRISPR/Cas system CSM-associated protein Csm2 small subunit
MCFFIEQPLSGGLSMKKYTVTLTSEERDYLEQITAKGKHRSRRIVNALTLLACDESKHQPNRSKNEEIAKVLNTSMRKIDRTKKRFVLDGFEAALEGKKSNRTYKKKVDGDFEAHLVALSCSSPPEGYSRWTLRLLADKAVELDYIENVSHETIRRVLKKTKSSLGNK